jgi:hypothetical protein
MSNKLWFRFQLFLPEEDDLCITEKEFPSFGEEQTLKITETFRVLGEAAWQT